MLEVAILYPDSPSDVRELEVWLGRLPKSEISKLVVFGKTEGSATLNDFSRDLAQQATDAIIRAASSDLLSRSVRLFSTGCEGIVSPITIAMAEIGARPKMEGAVGLVVGVGNSEPLPRYPRCDLDHIDAAARTVGLAIKDACLEPKQVSLVLIKSPVLSPGHVPSDARVAARHAGSTGSSRGAAALGAGIALAEVDRSKLGNDPVGHESVFSTRTMAFSGTETDRLEVVVLGERPGGDFRWGVSSVPLRDFFDNEGLSALKKIVGPTPQLVFFKAGIAPDGRLGGRRTTVLTSDLQPDKQLRAAASGFIAAQFGTISAFISGGTEHQAPPGGCICAALYRRRQATADRHHLAPKGGPPALPAWQ